MNTLNEQLMTLQILKNDFEKSQHLVEGKGVSFTDLLYRVMYDNKEKKNIRIGLFVSYFNRLDTLLRLRLLCQSFNKDKVYSENIHKQIQFVKDEFELSVIIALAETFKRVGVEKRPGFEEARYLISEFDAEKTMAIFNDITELSDRVRKYVSLMTEFGTFFSLKDQTYGSSLILACRDITSRMQPKKPKRKMMRWSSKVDEEEKKDWVKLAKQHQEAQKLKEKP